jgi:uncharacterized protein (DUF433 family)
VATLRSWVLGRSYPTRAGTRRFAPLIEVPSAKPCLLSFVNLVEAHVLCAIRREHDASLRRIERDSSGKVIRLYPYTRIETGHEPCVVMIDPLVSFGRPVLTGTGSPTSVVAERFTAGESVEDLARDYGRDGAEIEEAIRFELEVEAA